MSDLEFTAPRARGMTELELVWIERLSAAPVDEPAAVTIATLTISTRLVAKLSTDQAVAQ